MKTIITFLMVVALLAVSGSAQMNGNITSPQGSTIEITSGNRTYPAYLAVGPGDDKKPGVVLLHSFNGLVPGYKSITENLAGEGYVVIAPEWLTFGRPTQDEVVGQLIRDCLTYLKSRPDVNSSALGLTGHCAGGRYTMLFLPQIEGLKSGVAFYGFPYNRGDNQTSPADHISQLNVPMLIIHGTYDQASPVSDIYRYATDLNQSGKYFELKVYQGQPHEFMIKNGSLSQSFPAKDAYWQMVTFFNRTLKA